MAAILHMVSGCHMKLYIRSSTWHELKAVHNVLESLASNQRTHWFTDNQNVARILLVASRNPMLQKEVLDIINMSIVYQVRIEPKWIPGEANQQADFISQSMDYDDWSLYPVMFQKLGRMVWIGLQAS